MTNKDKHNDMLELLNLANTIKDTGKAVEERKSAINNFSWKAFFILKSGFTQDKQALNRMIKKGNELFDCRSYVSKAKGVLAALEAGAVIEVKDAEPVSMDTIKAFSADNIPSSSISTLYSVIRKEEKQANEINEYNKLIQEQATILLETEHTEKLEVLKDTLPEQFEELWQGAMDRAKAMLDAKLSGDKLASLKSDITNLTQSELDELAGYVASLVTKSHEVKQAETGKFFLELITKEESKAA